MKYIKMANEDERQKNCSALQSLTVGTILPIKIFLMVAAFAEFEKSLISSSLSSGQKTKARNSDYAGGKAPIGSEKGEKRLIPDEEKAATARRFLSDAEPEASLQKIADMLNSNDYTTKENKWFCPMQVEHILDRRAFYEGRYPYSE